MKTNIQNFTGQIMLALFALAAASMNLRAATITVTNAADSGAGTLRAALASANNGDTISFSLPTPAKITLTSGELLVSKSVTILGLGPANLAVDGNYPNTTNRVFHVTNVVTVTISSLTITNGVVTGGAFPANSGGGILNDHSTLTVSNCTLSGNSASYLGGAICNDGEISGSATLRIANSTLSGNSADTGGGIFNDGFFHGSAMLAISNSTLSGNSAIINSGGAIFNSGSSGSAILAIANSTLSGNSAASIADGIYNSGHDGGSATLTVVSSTISGHLAMSHFAIYDDAFQGSATLNIGSTILNAGTSGVSIGNSFGVGTITSLGYNLTSDGGGGVLTNATDQINTDPMLGPLQDNGGPTFTHALLPGSPAIDKGTNFTASATDQRGFPRTNDDLSLPNATGGDGTDIGAFEFQKVVLLAIERDGSGGFFIRYTGAPDVTYRLQRAAGVIGTWTNLATNTAPASGLIEYHDTSPLPGQAFYRTVQP